MTWTKKTLYTLIFTFSMSIPAQASEAFQAVINNILQAHGGAEVWKKTAAIAFTADTFSQSKHALGVTQRSYEHPDKFRISIEYPGNESELRQLNDGQVWDHGQVGSAPFSKATQLQAMRMMPAKQLLAHRATAKDLGTREDDEGTLHQGIEIIIDDLKLIIDTDAETGFILATWGIMQMMGQEMTFVTFYHDYRVIEGRAIAFKEEHYAMGSYTGHTEIKTVTFPSNLASELFQP